ncbi:60S acidic ribosomal protein P0-like [Microtus ochrogaster]|uniref:60S acidic ribosomal protein P0-like n=1 Tax=Microtus ochrogaster TaxID=79684 RepID=A0A8J6KNP8_MICOH|nr:60S acidic ribosomal protein P0-like [Microtus ochrogaster]
MGKNTMMWKAIRGHLENHPALEKLLPHIWGNVGFVFTKENLTEIRNMLLVNKVPAVACSGAITPLSHSSIHGYKQVLALSVETEYIFPLAEKVKALLADPSAFVAAALAAAATTDVPATAAAPAKAEAKEKLEESDDDMGFVLFG